MFPSIIYSKKTFFSLLIFSYSNIIFSILRYSKDKPDNLLNSFAASSKPLLIILPFKFNFSNFSHFLNDILLISDILLLERSNSFKLGKSKVNKESIFSILLQLKLKYCKFV